MGQPGETDSHPVTGQPLSGNQHQASGTPRAERTDSSHFKCGMRNEDGLQAATFVSNTVLLSKNPQVP